MSLHEPAEINRPIFFQNVSGDFWEIQIILMIDSCFNSAPD
jgi:hypothetical protein